MNIDLYIETNKGSQARIQRKYGYVIAGAVKGEVKTAEHFGSLLGTYHNTILYAIADALDHIFTTAEITIHIRDHHVAAKLQEVDQIVEAGFLDSRRKEISNAAEWKRIAGSIHRYRHQISAVTGKHEYTSWLLEEMAK